MLPALLLETRVLARLVEFGPLEGKEDSGYPEWRRYRTTPLLKAFVAIRR